MKNKAYSGLLSKEENSKPHIKEVAKRIEDTLNEHIERMSLMGWGYEDLMQALSWDLPRMAQELLAREDKKLEREWELSIVTPPTFPSTTSRLKIEIYTYKRSFEEQGVYRYGLF